MKSDKLLDAMGNLNDEILLDAKKGRSPSSAVQKRIIAAAAVFLILVVAGVAGKRVVGIISAEPSSITGEEENTVDISMLTTTRPEYITSNGDKIYVDYSSDAGLGYKFCYNSESMDGEIGIADSNGNVVLSPAYVSILPITEDRFIARKTGDGSPKSALVDENGKEIIPFFTGEIVRINAFSDVKNVVLSVEPSDGKHTFIDTDGKRVTSLEYDITAKNDFYGFFTGDVGDKKYIYDKDGELMFALGVNETADFEELDHGYTMVMKNCDGRLKYGLKNAEKLFIPCEYDEFTVISKDRIVARIGALDGVDPSDIARIFDAQGMQISTDGEFGTLIFASGNEHGIALGFTENGEIREWVVDTNGKQVSEKYEKVKLGSDGSFTAQVNGKQKKIELTE